MAAGHLLPPPHTLPPSPSPLPPPPYHATPSHVDMSSQTERPHDTSPRPAQDFSLIASTFSSRSNDLAGASTEPPENVQR